ncbi:hypothetical protein HDU85_001478 [Gaertneriomyces sp. JEL0708]|nr:hypothetical protein HDU85_001478 [Gaertneriomyces sp. JEL0708]
MGIPRLVPVFRSAFPKALGTESAYDGLVVIYSRLHSILPGSASAALDPFSTAVKAWTNIDRSATSGVAIVPAPGAPGGRIVLSPTGGLLGDVDDVRRYAEAARKGLARSRAAGIRRPLVLFPDTPVSGSSAGTAARLQRDYARYLEVAILGLLAEAYTPLQAREHLVKLGEREEPFDEIGIAVDSDDEQIMERAISVAFAVEEGRRVAKDIGGADPERMAPLKAAEYIERAFAQSDIKINILKDLETIKREYPLLHAVSRAALPVSRHHPAIVQLEYHSPDPSQVKENIFLIGKGVTYDTGGLDIKAGGVMRGMSRDKCGATAIAGFMKTVSVMKPKHVNIVATLGFVRNSCGSEGFVSDEILVSRAGVRVLVGNTDAEGRMVMVDLLAAAKEHALSAAYAAVPSRLLTVATLTGHAVRAVGPYAIALDNGPAKEAGVSKRLIEAGNVMGDPFELSTLRREDYAFVTPGAVTEDVVQANDKASTATCRGHQFPAAFMSVASGISVHGLDSDSPICYTHCDIAGSAEEDGKGLSLGAVTGSPVAALTGAFLL